MKYTAQSGKYIGKNFWYIFPFAIIPALLFSLSTDQEAITCLVDTLSAGTLSDAHFFHIFRAISILNFASPQSVIFGLLGVVGGVICVAMMMAQLDKHMRIGKRTYIGIFEKLNDNLLSTCGFVFLLFAIYELWSLLTSALLFWVMQISSIGLAYTVLSIVYVIMHFVLIYAVGVIYLWLPCMQITGFPALEALQYAQQLMVPIKWRIAWKQVLFLLFTQCLIVLCAFFFQSGVLFWVFASLLYAFLIMLFCVRMMVVYFDRDNIERADLKPYYQR